MAGSPKLNTAILRLAEPVWDNDNDTRGCEKGWKSGYGIVPFQTLKQYQLAFEGPT